MDDIKDWASLIAGGSGLGAFVLLVRMFLNRQEKSETAFRTDLKDARTEFTVDLKEIHKVFTNQLQLVTDRFTEQHEAQMAVNIRTVEAITGLRSDVQELQEKVK